MPADPSAIETLKTSEEPGQLVRAAQILAAADDAEGHRALRPYLESAAFLDKIDPPGQPVVTRLNLKIWKILRTLSDNRASSARAVLEALAESPLYGKQIDRTDLLLEASIPLRPPGPKIERFWTPCTAAGNLHAAVVQRVLLDNGSEAALRLFGDMMANERFPAAQRVRWIRSRVPRYRNGLPYVTMIRRVVGEAQVSTEVRLAAVEAVFDWDDEWGPVHGPDFQRPPARVLAKRDVRDATRELAKTARAVLKIPEVLDAKIGAVLKEFDTQDGSEPAQGQI